jgi:hypothetical protein
MTSHNTDLSSWDTLYISLSLFQAADIHYTAPSVCRTVWRRVAERLKNGEYTRIWKETVASQSQVQSRHLLGTEKNNEEIQLQIMSPPRFEVGTCRISLRNATTWECCVWNESQNISGEWNQDYRTHCAWRPAQEVCGTHYRQGTHSDTYVT